MGVAPVGTKLLKRPAGGMRRGRGLLMLCLLSAAPVAGCGGDDRKQSGGGGAGGGGDCKDADTALTAAARGHVGPLKVATDGAKGAEGAEGQVDRITVDVCRTTDEDATATVIVYGMRDDSIRDVRHQLRLIKVGGLWQVTNDLDTRRCQKGRGPQAFTGEYCQ